MPAHRRRLLAALTAAALAAFGTGALTAAPAAARPAAPPPAPPTAATYTVTVGKTGSYPYPDDTPAAVYTDKDGTFYFQQSHSLYGANDSRQWDFYTGRDFDHATRSATISDAVNPADPTDRNDDTTARCNNSPTGRQSSYAPTGSGYAQRNYCDLSGVWVDPDTGDWYGLVHNEFTPQPFGDGLHYDAIDYAVSTDQGRTWTIRDHAITSPYSTTRGDTAAFPAQTYSYGDGDQRLFTDTASGYFYVFYGSRIVDKGGSWGAFQQHVARAPIAAKMAPGSWQKWYDGAWSQPGAGGRESDLVPADSANPTGYLPPAKEYDPANPGTVKQQIAAGTLAPSTPLFVMNIAYDAYLGLYLGTPQAVDQSGNAPQQIYATADLSTQQWTLLGDTGGYHTASWYRWFLDSATLTGSTIVGKTFRSYCAFACSGSDGQYAELTVGSSRPAPAPFDPTRTYRIANGDGRVLAQRSGSPATTSLPGATGSALESWSFVGNGDGSYRIVNAATGGALGVDTSADTGRAGRAWGAAPTVGGGNGAGQQWFPVPAGSGFRLVNRYSGLVLGLTAAGSPAETTPARYWTDTTGSAVGGGRTAARQTLTLTPTGTATETVVFAGPGDQSSTVGRAASVQLSATDSAGKPLTFTATGLPAGLTVSPAGLISGTPTGPGVSKVTVTATSGTARASTTFTWSVTPALTGTHTLTTGGRALDDADNSTTAGNRLITWPLSGDSNQLWQFRAQPDGSYELVNGRSAMCADVSGGSGAAGAAVIQWPCTGRANQHWTVRLLADGRYALASVGSGLLLTADSAADGTPVAQQPDTGSPLQRWSIG
ncbi:ricin-type beta-trefoil lectin protein [Streptomyces sp. 1114.5]|uniref:RICIN domain-containing protein n=1 Tax=Streptomyces sp. 1114.5 TaxID=1938830 RepID=UPI000EAF6960|nr:RICIN domain-containing protein [Streptomyces sp. 1114.5]RKT12272.1 ricin-type beta-trefoil lectin protein [Streptomyces sp. 1114.5]